MRLRNVLLLVLALIVAVAVGVAIGPRLTNRFSSDRTTTEAKTANAEPAKPLTAPLAAEPQEHVARPRSRTAVQPAVAPTAPKLQNALKPLLHRGTDMTRAADGFRSGVQFAAVAHAAKNTDVPFVVLKHRVLDEKKSLAVAIHESKPHLNARHEADRAWSEARAELAEL